MHLAVAAIINALWDLWAKIEKKPLWRLLTDMEPEVSYSKFDYFFLFFFHIQKSEAYERRKKLLNNNKMSH